MCGHFSFGNWVLNKINVNKQYFCKQTYNKINRQQCSANFTYLNTTSGDILHFKDRLLIGTLQSHCDLLKLIFLCRTTEA